MTEEISVQKYLEGTSRILDIRREWARFMSTYPILVAPTSCDLPYKLDFDLKLVEETRRQLYAQAYLPTINLLGLPSVALPTRLVDIPDAPKGLPIGVQIIGQLHCDELALSVSALLQEDRFSDLSVQSILSDAAIKGRAFSLSEAQVPVHGLEPKYRAEM